MKRGRALIDAAAVATEVAAVAGVATRTVIAVPRATTANRAGNDLRGISPTSGVPSRASRLGWGGEGGLRDQKARVRRRSCVQLDSCLLSSCLLLTADCLLFSNGRRNLQGQPLAPAHDFDFVFLSGLHL